MSSIEFPSCLHKKKYTQVISVILFPKTRSGKGRELLKLAMPFVHSEFHRFCQVLIWPYQMLLSLHTMLRKSKLFLPKQPLNLTYDLKKDFFVNQVYGSFYCNRKHLCHFSKTTEEIKCAERGEQGLKEKPITLSITFSIERNILITLQDSQDSPYKCPSPPDIIS